MNRRNIIGSLIFLFFTGSILTGPAGAAVNLEAVCTGEEFQLEIGIINLYEDTDFVGVVVTRQTIGVCEDPVLVVADPIPLPSYAGTGWENMVFTEIPVEMPLPNVNYRFEAYLVDAAGNRSSDFVRGDLYPLPFPHDYVSCGEAVIMRGDLSPYPVKSIAFDVYVTPCAEGCWGYPLPILIAGFSYWDHPYLPYFSAGIVDLYGTVIDQVGSLPPTYPYSITRIELAPENACGPVPNDAQTWGGLKAMYR